MKKIVNWFGILKDMPLFTEAEPAAADEAAPIAVEEPTVASVEEVAEDAAQGKKKAAAKKK
jgi:hypothetical protein